MSSNTSEAAIPAREQEEEANQQQSAPSSVPDAALTTSATHTHAGESEQMAVQPKPDVSDKDYTELLPKLMSYFHNNREELARALGLHRSTVDRWLNGTSRPNNSTVLRMRRVVQERRIE